eukprot:1882702-Lingulodinium_polyedra.AAC.1
MLTPFPPPQIPIFLLTNTSNTAVHCNGPGRQQPRGNSCCAKPNAGPVKCGKELHLKLRCATIVIYAIPHATRCAAIFYAISYNLLYRIMDVLCYEMPCT